MFKKTLLLLLFAFFLGYLMSCSEETTTVVESTTETTTVASIQLPDLTGLNQTEALSILSLLKITVIYEAEESDTIDDSLFIRYSDDYQAGDTIAEDSTLTVYFSVNYPELPDFTGYSKENIRSELDGLGINYIFQYETNTELVEDSFIRYDGEYIAGDTIINDDVIVVIISTKKLILPDLTGYTQVEIFTTLMTLNINFVIEVVTDNTVEDQTFSSYGDGLEAGDLIPSNFTVTVNLGFNSTRLPDLTDMIKEEIEDVLSDLNINYQFEYIVNDNFTEDYFIAYKDMEIGDFYEEGIITIQLYKNTFTDNETSLIISKYVDGGDDTFNQAIELYNPTDSTVNLSNYYLAIMSNGSYYETYHISFENIDLLPGETYVIANYSASGNLLVHADLITEDLIFDGNDTIQLCYINGTYIDTIYNLGNRDFTLDNEIFIRNQDVVVGTRSYIFNEWSGFVPDYFEVLGTFPYDLPTEISIEIVQRGFDDPLGGMDYVVLAGINDGDTASFTPGFLSGDRVRFLGVDTPETYPYVDDWGLEAKAYTTLILNNAVQIYIQSDPDSGYTDTYGRHLGLVWVDMGQETFRVEIKNSSGEVVRVEELSGWILLNYHLVLNGYSYNYFGGDSSLAFDNKYLSRWFQEAERYASTNGLGVHE